MLVALGIGADGTKTPLGLWEGATENKAVVTALLADLVERGLDAEAGLLAVVDGGKALSTGRRAVFGNTVVIPAGPPDRGLLTPPLGRHRLRTWTRLEPGRRHQTNVSTHLADICLPDACANPSTCAGVLPDTNRQSC